MNELKIKLGVPSEIADICCQSINMEAGSEALSRSRINLSHRGDYLNLEISARDLSALRAALNTYLRWVIMCRDLLKN